MMGEDAIIVAIVFGSVLTIVFMGIVGSIINNWIKRGSKSGDITKNKEFLAALREFKEKTDRRLSNLEAIVTDERDLQSKPEMKNKPREKKQEHSRAIEIEMDDEKDSDKSKSSGNLRNMLNQ